MLQARDTNLHATLRSARYPLATLRLYVATLLAVLVATLGATLILRSNTRHMTLGYVHNTLLLAALNRPLPPLAACRPACRRSPILPRYM